MINAPADPACTPALKFEEFDVSGSAAVTDIDPYEAA
jgi:hypothetical protein